VVSVTPRPRFTPGKGPPVPIVQEAEWVSELVWTQRLEEKSFTSAGNPIKHTCCDFYHTYMVKLRDAEKITKKIKTN
jgi:hypothetical protein